MTEKGTETSTDIANDVKQRGKAVRSRTKGTVAVELWSPATVRRAD